jgi:hypothetical protein
MPFSQKKIPNPGGAEDIGVTQRSLHRDVQFLF